MIRKADIAYRLVWIENHLEVMDMHFTTLSDAKRNEAELISSGVYRSEILSFVAPEELRHRLVDWMAGKWESDRVRHTLSSAIQELLEGALK